MLRRPPTRLELKGEDKDEFERLRRERVNARELGTIGARDSVDGDAVRRAERERERERRIGIAEVREEE
ncbi:Anaphase-promoting complex, subunit CDC26 [Ostreococcus tauri]|uniref:Anaphase-promoting complex, subunit CDC26 n=1 Tax=Ostreococcus tauri TaxID=70448 RepID=A0A090M6P8_OSTTA|nr:Anaphase-promoting complex, subunit CDC26 [Ostreococcus tauri]CEF99905.1 Anaphase-promoting complex, subunit CDC26 [Ostreococcus tauri]|eukprot:XP_022840105.1 Anaphase-promoting complex, subunit CDC26 [Ostreococcus tauri]